MRSIKYFLTNKPSLCIHYSYTFKKKRKDNLVRAEDLLDFCVICPTYYDQTSGYFCTRSKSIKKIVASLGQLFKSFVRLIPVNDVPECLDKFGSLILVINVICMFKDVQNH